MAISCINCGAVLPKDDARFCNNCGKQQTTRPVHPGSGATSKRGADSSPGSETTTAQAAPVQEKSRPALREQIARQPPARPVRLVPPDKSPPATHGGSFSAPTRERRAENLPLRSLATHLPEQPGTSPAREYAVQPTYQDEVALLDTVHLATSAQSSPGVPSTPIPPVRQQISPGEVRSEQKRQLQKPVTDHPALSFLPPTRHQHRILLLVIVALLCLLVVGGLGTWIVVAQPFNVPAVTQPQQSFKDSSLGLSLLYPSGWMTQVNRALATAHFYDSSHTAEVMITVKNATTSNVAQYLQQQVAQLGITNAKLGTSLSFAGASWQLVQGSVQRSGANYTESILATVHGNRLFTFIQLAPQSIYADEEKLVFSGIRSSLQFI